MKRVYIYTHDPMLTMFYTESEYLELFGDDEYTIEIPAALHDKFIEAKSNFYSVVNELEQFLKGKQNV